MFYIYFKGFPLSPRPCQKFDTRGEAEAVIRTLEFHYPVFRNDLEVR